jgi:hypothetical protein
MVYPKFDQKAVTKTFSRMLWDVRHRGWGGTLTSGKRSRARQLQLYLGFLHHLPGFNAADTPDRSAHCRNGWRCAVDVTRGDEFVRVARARGWPVHRPHPNEPWHVEFTRRPRNTQKGRGPH